MKVLYLVRHAQASFGAIDYDQLSPLGYEQSTLLANHLKQIDCSFDAFTSGTLKRHQQTALATLSSFDIGLDCDPNWNEFDHRNIFEIARRENPQWADNAHQHSSTELIQRFSIAVERWIQSDDPSVYRESWPQFSARVQAALLKTINQVEKKGVVFTSGGVIAAIIGYNWKLSAHQVLQLNWSLVNTGITKLLITKQNVQVSSINVHSHLDTSQQKNKITYK